MEDNPQATEPQFFFADDLTYDCVVCGKCCRRGWTVHVEPEAYNRLRTTPVYQKKKEKLDGVEPFNLDMEKRQCTMQMTGEQCVFVNEEGLCEMHIELGLDPKPIICRWYPFILSPTPEGIYVGVEFGCTGVQEGAGKPLAEYESYIRNLHKEFIRDTLGEQGVPLFDDVQTNYNGYKKLEPFVAECLQRINDPGKALWLPLMSMVMLVMHCRENQRTMLLPVELEEYLRTPLTVPFDRDEIYLSQEFEYAMYLVTLLETPEQEQRDATLEALMGNGEFYCKTLKADVNVGKLKEYIKKNKSSWKDKEYIRYAKHLVWQKTLLKTPDVLGGVALLNIGRQLFDWYTYAAAFNRNAQEPELQDARFALGVLEGAIKHDVNDAALRYSKAFADSIVKQVSLMLQPGPDNTKKK